MLRVGRSHADAWLSGTVRAAPTEIQFWHSMQATLGAELNGIVDKFNASQSDYKIVPVFKGNYEESMAAGIAAYRAGNAPAILQVYEVGTATMMSARQAIVPVYELFQNAGVPFSEGAFIPPVSGYYSAGHPQRLISMPFNSSTTVLYYNKDAFTKAGLDPNKLPRTLDELVADATKLKASGMPCGYTTGWQAWVHIEESAPWNGLPIATKNNGFDGLDTTLLFNGPAQVQHIALLQKMAKDGTFTYVGRTTEAEPKFYSGDCGLITTSSGALGDIKNHAKFDFGVAMMPYDQHLKGAPQNAIIGGASLWVLAGKSPEVYKGVAKFLSFLSGDGGKMERRYGLSARYESGNREVAKRRVLHPASRQRRRHRADAEQAPAALHARPALGEHAADPDRRRRGA